MEVMYKIAPSEKKLTLFLDKEYINFYKFGYSIFTSTSDNIEKKDFKELKKELQKQEFFTNKEEKGTEELEKLLINKGFKSWNI